MGIGDPRIYGFPGFFLGGDDGPLLLPDGGFFSFLWTMILSASGSCGAVEVEEKDGGFELYEPLTCEIAEDVVRVLVAAGTPPIHLAVQQEDLEMHFLRMTEG